MLDDKQIEYLAELAKMDILPKEKKQLRKQLNNILEYVGKLQKIKGLSEPDYFADPVKNVNRWREDKVGNENEQQRQMILQNAPALKEDLIKTKPVFEDEE